MYIPEQQQVSGTLAVSGPPDGHQRDIASRMAADLASQGWRIKLDDHGTVEEMGPPVSTRHLTIQVRTEGKEVEMLLAAAEAALHDLLIYHDAPVGTDNHGQPREQRCDGCDVCEQTIPALRAALAGARGAAS